MVVVKMKVMNVVMMGNGGEGNGGGEDGGDECCHDGIKAE